MAVQRKPSIVGRSLTGTVPPLPNVPRGTINRFEELEGYDSEMQRWWARFGELNQRDREQLEAQLKADREADAAAIAAANVLIAALQGLVATLQAQVAALIASGGGDALAIAALQSDLSAHITATAAHGTAGNIVGTTDSQELSNKVIGLSGPKYGRFAPPVGLGNIPHGQTVTINSGDYLVIAGDFEVIGDLTVDGTLVAVP